MDEKVVAMSPLARLRYRLSKLSVIMQLYVFGIAMVLVAIAFMVLPVPKPAAGSAISIAMTAFVLGLVSECWSWLVKRFNYPVFKLLVAILSFMAAAIATGASASYVASATGQDPTQFKSTITFLAPLAFVPLLALVLMVASLCSLPLVMLLSLKEQISKLGSSDLPVLLLVGRLLGIFGCISGLQMIIDPFVGVDTRLQALAARSAYYLDMQPNRDCAPTPGDHVTRINDEIVIVGRITEEGPRFNRQLCRLEASAAQLPPPVHRRREDEPASE